MKKLNYYMSDFGAPPPPPPPPAGTPPPPPPPVSNFGSSPINTGSASTNAIIALVAGILSFVMCPFILGIVAWFMGKGEINKINNQQSAEAGRSMATIGMWLGIVNTILSVLAIIAYILIIIIAILTSSSR